VLISQWKTGYKTTEFWVSVAMLLIPVFNGILPEGSQLDAESIIAAGIAAASYIGGRSFLKGKRNEAVASSPGVVMDDDNALEVDEEPPVRTDAHASA